ncbi:hypothetical protein WJX73_001243 [Symbiochloris irregularis]|uniref:Uncharacterized protein n=1 Tax=Symbiochloris irregularis TaxID=706552 RepID=A0AAW1NQW3_9CHLO
MSTGPVAFAQSSHQAVLDKLVEAAVGKKDVHTHTRMKAVHKLLGRYWWQSDSLARVPLVKEHDKAAVRKLVLETAIGEERPEIAASATNALLQIAAVDFPAYWPDLIRELMAALSPPREITQIIGAIKCLKTLAENSTLREKDSYEAIPRLLPSLFAAAQHCSDKVQRSQLTHVDIFTIVKAAVSWIEPIQADRSTQQSQMLTSLLDPYLQVAATAVETVDIKQADELPDLFAALDFVRQLMMTCAELSVPELAGRIFAGLHNLLERELPTFLQDNTQAQSAQSAKMSDLIKMINHVWSLLAEALTSKPVRQQLMSTPGLSTRARVELAIDYMQIRSWDFEAWETTAGPLRRPVAMAAGLDGSVRGSLAYMLSSVMRLSSRLTPKVADAVFDAASTCLEDVRLPIVVRCAATTAINDLWMHFPSEERIMPLFRRLTACLALSSCATDLKPAALEALGALIRDNANLAVLHEPTLLELIGDTFRLVPDENPGADQAALRLLRQMAAHGDDQMLERILTAIMPAVYQICHHSADQFSIFEALDTAVEMLQRASVKTNASWVYRLSDELLIVMRVPFITSLCVILQKMFQSLRWQMTPHIPDVLRAVLARLALRGDGVSLEDRTKMGCIEVVAAAILLEPDWTLEMLGSNNFSELAGLPHQNAIGFVLTMWMRVHSESDNHGLSLATRALAHLLGQGFRREYDFKLEGRLVHMADHAYPLPQMWPAHVKMMEVVLESLQLWKEGNHNEAKIDGEKGVRCFAPAVRLGHPAITLEPDPQWEFGKTFLVDLEQFVEEQIGAFRRRDPWLFSECCRLLTEDQVSRLQAVVSPHLENGSSH